MYYLPELRKYLERLHAGHLLDVATGEGEFLLFLLESFASFDSATGLDVSSESIKLAKEKLSHYKIDFVLGNIRKLPFEDNYFDTVTVSNSIHHFELAVKAITSLARVLSPGGLLLINEMIYEELNPAQQNHYDYHCLKAEIDKANGIYHRKIYTSDELLSIIREANVEIDFTILSNNEMPILNSREKMWQFFRKIDEMTGFAAHLPNGQEYEERAIMIKENISKTGFQIPPQLAVLAYKS
jgi:SAM-dependent methyltransferase